MLGLKNSTNATKSAQKPLSVDDIPVHSMKEDLEHPEKFSLINKPIEKTEAPKASPFLREKTISTDPAPLPVQPTSIPTPPSIAPSTKSAPVSLEKTVSTFSSSSAPTSPFVSTPIVKQSIEQKSPLAAQIPLPPKETSPKNEPEKFSNLVPENNSSPGKKSLIIILIIFLLASSAVGGYFFWMKMKKSAQTEVSTQTAPETPSQTEAPAQEEKPAIKPSLDGENPNPIEIDIKTADSKIIWEKIGEAASKVSTSEIQNPVEFSLKNTDGSSISFQDFSAKTGIKLSPNIMNNLESDFSLFLFNENGTVKTGLFLKMKNEKTMTGLMLKEEPTLVSKLSPLLMGKENKEKTKKFSDGIHENLKIRYNNLESPFFLSIDYAFSEKKMIIGTSKMTLRSIYDRIKSR